MASIFTAAGASSLALSNIRPNFSNAYTETYNFNLQQAFPQGTVLNIGYYGSEGKHLRVRVTANQPFGSNTTRPYQAVSLASPYAAGRSLAAANIAQVDAVSHSEYNALWVTATKSLTHGLQFLFTYNWTKSEDLNSLGSQGGYALQDSSNPTTSFGLSDFDTRHRIAANAVWDVPGKHFAHVNDRFLSGFRLSGIEQWQTGNPVNIVNTSTYTGVSGLIHPSLVGNIVRTKIETHQRRHLLPGAQLQRRRDARLRPAQYRHAQRRRLHALRLRQHQAQLGYGPRLFPTSTSRLRKIPKSLSASIFSFASMPLT